MVVGTRGRSGAERMLLGSVSDHVVRHAGCPVLVVRTAVPAAMAPARSGAHGEGRVRRATGDRGGRALPSVAMAVGMVLVALSCVTCVRGRRHGPRTPDLDVVLDSTQHWVGTNDVLLSVYDAPAASLADRTRARSHVELIGPAGQRLAVEPAIERFATYGRQLYRARVPLDEVGRWEVRVSDR